MPSPLHTTLLNTISGYIEKSKAADILSRQIDKTKATPDTFEQKDLTAILTSITGAAALYVPDKGRRDELIAKLRAMA